MMNKICVPCPDCNKILDIANCEVSEIIECPDCGVELEIILVDGNKKFKHLEIEGEDWGE